MTTIANGSANRQDGWKRDPSTYVHPYYSRLGSQCGIYHIEIRYFFFQCEREYRLVHELHYYLSYDDIPAAAAKCDDNALGVMSQILACVDQTKFIMFVWIEWV
jgi:hypothetical protein